MGRLDHLNLLLKLTNAGLCGSAVVVVVGWSGWIYGLLILSVLFNRGML